MLHIFVIHRLDFEEMKGFLRLHGWVNFLQSKTRRTDRGREQEMGINLKNDVPCGEGERGKRENPS